MPGKSFSRQVRGAVDLHLDPLVEDKKELRALARAANQSAGRTIKKLDETLADLDRMRKTMSRRK